MSESTNQTHGTSMEAHSRTALCRADAPRAQVLRSVSGLTAGVTPSRRGSFLVLVVGVLALLSVIAVLYATLGMGDRQRSAAVVKKRALDNFPEEVRDYLAQIITDDALDSIHEIRPSGGSYSISRESWDYPFTSWQSVNFAGNASATAPLFSPTGAPRRDASGDIVNDTPPQWIPSDPYLASTEPTFLDFQGLRTSIPLGDLYKERRDWAHITNASPDGRFVNLWFLRGDFDVASRAMTADLSIPGTTETRDPHKPASFDSRQFGAFRPMFDALLPSDKQHIFNQWADADGDGFADSRWAELVDASMGAEFSVLPRDPNLRYFVASRIIDLNGLVNINTATDMMASPDGFRPVGSSPGEINLRELLMLVAQADKQYTTPTGAPGGTSLYDAIPHVAARDPGGVQNYFDYDPDNAKDIGHYSYQAAKVSLAAGSPVPPSESLGFNPNFGFYGAYITGPIVPPPGNTGEFSFADQYGLTGVAERQAWDVDLPLANAPLSAAQARYEAYDKRFSSQQASFLVKTVGANPTFRTDNLGLFATDDLFELLTYRGVNDPSVRSNLEMVLGGRGDGDAIGLDFSAFSPLRDNRQLSFERPQSLTAASTDATQWERYMLLRAADIRQRITTISGARELRLATNIYTPDRLDESETRINPINLLAGIGITTRTVATPDHPVDANFDVLFLHYIKSLAPYLNDNEPGTGINAAWGDGVNLSYGHQGGEFAFLTSAFMAMNMADKFDLDSVPQARTILIDSDYRVDLNLENAVDGAGNPLLPFWNSTRGAADAHVGDETPAANFFDSNPAAQTLASSGRGDVVNSPAINAFGVEAQPFITGSTVFTVYTDAPVSATNPTPETAGDPVTIRGEIARDNSDFVMRVFAVQLTNPFNVAIQLGAEELDPQSDANPRGMNLKWLDIGDDKFPAFTKFKDYFYLEFGGRQYALARLEVATFGGNPGNDPYDASGPTGSFRSADTPGIDVVAKPIIIPPGESIVVYALSQVPHAIMDRMADVATDVSGGNLLEDDGFSDNGVTMPRKASANEFHRIIRQHIGEKGLGIGRPTTILTPGDGDRDLDGMYWIPEMHSPINPASGNRKVGALGMTFDEPVNTGANFTRFTDDSTTDDEKFSDILHEDATNADPSYGVDSIKLWRAIRSGIDDSNNPVITADPQFGEYNRVAAVPDDFPDFAWDENTDYRPPTNSFLFVDNQRYNDMLVDRMRLPRSSSARRNADFNKNTRLPDAAVNEVEGTACNTPGPNIGDPPDIGDDTGFTITLWDAVHRPKDPQGGGDAIKSGSLPAYCMERKFSGPVGTAGNVFWNVYVPDEVHDQELNIVHFESTDPNLIARGSNVEFSEWFQDPTENAPEDNSVVILAVGESPAHRITDLSDDDAIDVLQRLNNTGSTAVEKVAFQLDRPELIVNNDRFSPPSLIFDPSQCFLRVTDLLTALPIGTIHDPLTTDIPLNWPTEMTLDDVTWTTLSESFCLALGYETAPYPDSPCAVRAMYPARLDPNTNIYYRNYDHGQLKLDDFVAFYDTDGDGVVTPGFEFRRGAQTPLAWNILDTFSVFRPTLDSFTPGVINVNTASQDVLAAVPMLAPTTTAADPFLRGATRNPWWWTINATDPLNNPDATAQTPASDITATLAAVRDKSVGFFRPASVPAALGGQTFVDFEEAAPLDQYQDYDGRAFRTGIVDIGELPGFRTPGSILMARWRDSSNPTLAAETPGSPSNIDYLSLDQNAGVPADSSFRGVSSGLTQNWENGAWKTTPNKQANDYQEKLAIASGALGSISTRSDIYAAWFVIQGYTKDDVSNLRPEDPMVPSVKRRFVMVVDRSNVRQLGDKPKILLFKEVPVD